MQLSPAPKDEINYSDSIVCFIDILGYKELISSSKSQEQARPIIEKIINSLKKHVSKVLEERGIKSTSRRKIKIFSDCISISSPNTLGDFLVCISTIATMQRQLIADGILIRGGISSGLHYESREMIFSQALVDAYELESKHAAYPRIIISKSLIKMHANNEPIGAKKLTLCHLFSVFMSVDSDGHYFINYFINVKRTKPQEMQALISDLTKHREYITESRKRTSTIQRFWINCHGWSDFIISHVTTME